MPAILFVCIGNQYRSPVAAAYLIRLLQERGLDGWRVESAGTWASPGQPSGEMANNAAQSVGIDIHEHITRIVNETLLAEYDLILVMEQGQKEALSIEFPGVAPRIYLLSEMSDDVPYDIPDPLSQPHRRQQILMDMCNLIECGLPRIEELANSSSKGKP